MRTGILWLAGFWAGIMKENKEETMPIKKSNNPFAGKAKPGAGKKTNSGKRVGKSKQEKANNQLNRRVK